MEATVSCISPPMSRPDMRCELSGQSRVSVDWAPLKRLECHRRGRLGTPVRARVSALESRRIRAGVLAWRTHRRRASRRDESLSGDEHAGEPLGHTIDFAHIAILQRDIEDATAHARGRTAP